MHIIEDIEQGSEEWLKMRLGVVTGSKFKDVMAGGQGKTRKAYMYQLAAEILTGEQQETFSNQYMEWGTQTEPQARAMYELRNECDVKEVAFIKQNPEARIGVSPDGLVGDYGLVEFKCPKTTTQIETFISGKMPSSHKAQVQGQIMISGREWCDFVSFDPRINGDASWFCVRVERDQKYCNEMYSSILSFIDELDELVKLLRG